MSRIIAVDFDGTCVTHEFPLVGRSIGAEPVLRELVRRGDKLILWTMRDGKYLQDAVDWCERNGIEIWGVNSNPDQKVWTSSPKAHAHIYIDDCAFGVPLVYPIAGRPYVNWGEVSRVLL